jgi:hypothetical protein
VILAAGLLVLLGLGLFVAGLATGATVLYWLCVVACVAAGVLLVTARLRMGRAAPGRRTPADAPPATPAPPATGQLPVRGATAASVVGPDTGSAVAAPAASAPPAAGDPAVPASADLPAAVPPPAERAPEDGQPAGPATGERAVASAAHARRGTGEVPLDTAGDPPVEEVEVTDLLLVVDLRDEVLVVDEHPRYHLPGCRWLGTRTTIPLPLDEARTDGFTPCGFCSPDRTLAERERARRAGRKG